MFSQSLSAPNLTIRDIARFIGFCAVYTVFAYGAFAFLISPDGIAVIWPASGVFLAALLLTPHSHWWAMAGILGLIDFAMEITIGGSSIFSGAIFSLITTGQALASAVLLQHFHKRALSFDSLDDVTALFLWGGALPIAVFAVLAAMASYTLLDGDLLQSWLWWLIADGLGVLVLCPLVLLWSQLPITGIKQMSASARLELVTALIILGLVTHFVFTVENPSGAALASYSYLPFPILIWIAIRFGGKYTALASFILVAKAIWFDALVDTGGVESVRSSLIALEAFLLLVVSASLLLAALVAERANNSKRLAESLNRLDLAMRAGNDGLWDWDIAHDEIYYSPRWKSMLGYADDEFPNDPNATFALIHPDDSEKSIQMLNDFISGKDDHFKIEARIQHKDGHWVDILSKGFIERDEKGNAVRLTGTHVDLTKRKQAERALRQSEKSLRNLINFSPVGIFLSTDRKYVFTNPAAANILGLKDPEDIIGKAVTTFHHPEDIAKATKRIDRLLTGETNTIPQFEFKIVNANGIERDLEATTTTIQWQGKLAIMTMLSDITERKQTEEAFRRNTLRLKEAQAIGQIGDWEFDIGTGAVFWSDELYKLYERDPMLGPPDFEQAMSYYIAEDSKLLQECIRLAIETGEGYELDLKARYASGREASLFVIGYAIKNDQGKVIKMHGIAQDITQRKAIEEALRNSESKLAEAQAIAKIGNWELDLVTNNISYSAEHLRLHGLNPSSEDVTTKTLSNAIHPDDRERCQRDFSVFTKQESADHFQLEFRVIWPDGSIHWLEGRGNKLKDENSQPTRLVGTVQDITERKMAEESLTTSEARYKALISSSNTGAWEYFSDSGYLWCSTEYFSMLGRDQDDYDLSGNKNLKETWTDLLHPDDQKRAADHFSAYLANPQGMYENYFRMKHVDGHWVWILSRGKLLQDQNGNYTNRTIGTHIDITQQKQIEEQLRRSQKMDALGKLTGGIAHDYNNMLNVIMGYSQLLKTELPDDSKLDVYLDEIVHAGERGAKLTKKLLSFSRQEQSDAESLNINTLLHDEKNMLQKTLTPRIQLNLELGEDLWPVWLDSGALEDAILNLSINAMHAMEDGGSLTFETFNEKLIASDAELLDLKEGDYVSLRMTDTGIGMDETTRNRMFDPFFTTKGKMGTGLGLSQVYGFVQSSGGTIQVYSEPDRGTRIILYFPRNIMNDDKKQTSQIDEVINLNGTETVLVVDDEPALANFAYEILTAYGYHVRTANDGQQALTELEKEPVDLLLSDIIMPNMDGYQLAAHVQQHYPDIKIQLCSGFADDRNAEMVDDILHQKLLKKPYTSDVLLKRVRGLLDEKTSSTNTNNSTATVMGGD